MISSYITKDMWAHRELSKIPVDVHAVYTRKHVPPPPVMG